MATDPLAWTSTEPSHKADDAWMEHTACAGAPIDWWFAPMGSATAARNAKKVCAVCPVRDECLEFALATVQRYGIWGGVTARDRRGMGRARGH